MSSKELFEGMLAHAYAEQRMKPKLWTALVEYQNAVEAASMKAELLGRELNQDEIDKIMAGIEGAKEADRAYDSLTQEFELLNSKINKRS